MTTFLITLIATFALLLTLGLFIGYSKRRQSRTKHGLTGMCHETGGEMCGCCSSSMLNIRREPRSDQHLHSSCDKPDFPPTISHN